MPRVAEILRAEERRLAARAEYRPPAQRLRTLAVGHMILETAGGGAGSWDRFLVRNVGLAVQRRMAEEFGGDGDRIRRASAASVERALGRGTEDGRRRIAAPFGDLASYSR